jgi:hypothetical protein
MTKPRSTPSATASSSAAVIDIGAYRQTVPADPFADLNKLQLTPEMAAMAAASKAPTKAQQRQPKSDDDEFAKLTVRWIKALATARYIATLKLAHHLLYQDFKKPGAWVVIANTTVAGVTRDTKGPALAELVELGLVEVEWRPKKSPKAHIRK